jgi:hypothetical protein
VSEVSQFLAGSKRQGKVDFNKIIIRETPAAPWAGISTIPEDYPVVRKLRNKRSPQGGFYRFFKKKKGKTSIGVLGYMFSLPIFLKR